ncbi:MAG TPA: hypothetical protein VJT10_15095 [Steroidobacteraceae bacterium]|nr:hypothetical protein [Steroidobacteraceae bacterium]
MAIRPTQPQRADGVLDTAVRLSKASVVKVLPLSLLMMLASTPGSFYVFIAGGGVDMSDPFGMVRLMLSPGYLLVSAASCIVMMLIAAAVSLRMAAIADDGDMSTATALLQALRHVPSLLVSLVLYVIVVGIGPLLLVAPIVLSRGGSIAVTLGALLTIASVIPGVSLLLFVGTNLFENKGPIAALIASHRLVWGKWWHTNAVLVVGTLVLIVIYAIAALLVGMVAAVQVLVGGGANLALTSLIGDLLIGLVSSPFVTPFSVAMFLAIYWDLHLRRPGGDDRERASG